MSHIAIRNKVVCIPIQGRQLKTETHLRPIKYYDLIVNKVHKKGLEKLFRMLHKLFTASGNFLAVWLDCNAFVSHKSWIAVQWNMFIYWTETSIKFQDVKNQNARMTSIFKTKSWQLSYMSDDKIFNLRNFTWRWMA